MAHREKMVSQLNLQERHLELLAVDYMGWCKFSFFFFIPKARKSKQGESPQCCEVVHGQEQKVHWHFSIHG
jgi:hypothetical protein